MISSSAIKNNNSSYLVWIVFVGYLVYNYNKKCVTFQYTHLMQQFDLSQQNAGNSKQTNKQNSHFTVRF